MKERKQIKIINIIKKITIALIIVAMIVLKENSVFATDDPLTVIQNLSDFMFSVIRLVGTCLLGFGIVQVGLALKSHDASQRANGFLALAGGVIITFAKEILNLITGGTNS